MRQTGRRRDDGVIETLQFPRAPRRPAADFKQRHADLRDRMKTFVLAVLYNIQPNLSRLLGRGSVFALDGADHRRRRKLLTRAPAPATQLPCRCEHSQPQ